MAHILCTGIATIDIVNTTPCYPAEDAELRAISQSINVGGNAANTSRVLAQLDHRVAFTGVIANDEGGERILQTLGQSDVEVTFTQRQDGSTPTSYITLNAKNGSRTIVHHRDLAELEHQHFRSLPLETFDAFFFEGRNIPELAEMLAYTRTQRVDQPVFLELEKPREGLEALPHLADIVLISRPYAESLGFSHPKDCLRALHRQYPQQFLSLTWGESGARGMTPSGEELEIPASPVSRVIDSLGAGDTYNAGAINALISGHTFEEALRAGSQLAARKVQQHGFDSLVN